MPALHSHCSFCGAPFAEDVAWPRRCGSCSNTTYRNPLPVAVALVPVNGGLLTVRRSIPPRLGELALPGGFMEIGEGWREAVARELFEETGISLPASGVAFFEALSSPGGHFLVFGLCPELPELPAFVVNTEVSELVVVRDRVELAFPLHTEVLHRWLG
jgi:ADP-ribose pyrophosphatase YjhB (NUDIX family)